MNYEMMVPPFKQKAFFEMNKSEAKQYFDWYMEEKSKRILILSNFIKSEGFNIPLDFTVKSLDSIWQWYITKIKYREKSKSEIKNEVNRFPEWMLDFITKETISYETWMYGMDVAIYFAEVFIHNSEGKIEWGYFTKPKNRIGVNQPTLLGFKYDKDLNPRTIVANCTRTFAKENSLTMLSDIYRVWKEWV